MASMMLLKIIFALFSMIIATLDIKTGAVPRFVFIFAFPFFSVFKALLQEGNPLMESAIGILAGLIVFLLAYFFSGRKLGLADVWYSALFGLVLGPWWWYGTIILSCIIGAICILAAKQRQITFIPCMAFASIAMDILKGVLQ